MVKCIIVTHGKLGEELIRTARTILGDFEGCRAFSNTGVSTQRLYDDIASSLDDEPYLIFVDFLGGSCSHACLRVAADRPQTALLTGVNLPMLLAFLNKRDEVPFNGLPRAVVERAREAVQVIDPEAT